ncbi:ABC transporter substrate-binding protein [Arthrobacter psychrolactophilus]
MNFAFDRKTILEQQYLGEGTPTNQVFGPESGAYVDELDSSYPYDPAKAKALLAEAGYPNGFELKIPTMTGFEAITATVQQQLGDVGIKVQLETIPQANYVPDLASSQVLGRRLQPVPGRALGCHQPDDFHLCPVQPLQVNDAGIGNHDRRCAERWRAELRKG